MFVVIFLIVLGITTLYTNRTCGVDSSDEFLSWSKQDIFVIGACFFVACILQMVELTPIAYFVYAAVCFLACIYVNKSREKRIEEYKLQIQQVSDSVENLVKKADISNYSNLPFEITKDKEGNVSKIEVLMKEPKKFNDTNCTNTVYSLKKFFPYFDWQYSTDYPQQLCIFAGQPLPPKIALYPGSDMRSSHFIPLGVSGDGEVGWAFTSKDWGQSSYLYESGETAKNLSLPHAPQAICVGSTGGGKAIWVEQELW